MAATRAALAFFAPDIPVFELPAWDCLPYDRVGPNAGVAAARMAVLSVMAHGLPQPSVVLTSITAATQRVPAHTILKGASFVAQKGDSC